MFLTKEEIRRLKRLSLDLEEQIEDANESAKNAHSHLIRMKKELVAGEEGVEQRIKANAFDGLVSNLRLAKLDADLLIELSKENKDGKS